MRAFFVMVVAALSVAVGYAQDIHDDVAINDFTIELKDNGYLNVDIDLDLTNLDIKTTQVVVLTPVIINGENSHELKSIAVYGRNRRIYYLRNEDKRPTTSEDIILSPAESRGVVKYSTSLYFAEWMNGCSIRILRADFGCCGVPSSLLFTEVVNEFPIKPYYPELKIGRAHV